MNRRFPDFVRPLAVVICAYIAVFFTLAYRKYACLGSDSGDYGFFNNMFWWTIHGRPFYATGIGFSNLGIHTAFLWAQLVPVYWLFPGIPTLLFMQTVFIGATAVPMYLIARHVLQEHRSSLLLATAFVLLPPIVSQNVNQVEEPSFMAIYLLFAFYFFLKEKFLWFMLFGVISCLGRENVPLAITMFGVYSALLRRGKKWIVAPVIMGLGYFWIAMFVIMPYFRHGHSWHVMRMFRYLGDTPQDILLAIFHNPLVVAQHMLESENVNYIVMLLQPLGWILPFLNPACLMALPDLAINTISDNSAMKVIPWHYNVVTSCFLFVSVIFVLRRLSGWLKQLYGGSPEIVLATSLLVLSLAHWFVWFSPQQYRKLPQHEALLRAVEHVPRGKSVLAPLRIMSRVSFGEHFNNISVFVNYPDFADQFEYVILDANERQYQPIITREFFDRFYRNPKYQLRFAEQNVFVFQRMGGESDWKIPVP